MRVHGRLLRFHARLLESLAPVISKSLTSPRRLDLESRADWSAALPFALPPLPSSPTLPRRPSQVLLHRGDVPHDLHFLLKGKVEIVSGVDGRALYRLDQGAHFGESVSSPHTPAMDSALPPHTKRPWTQLNTHRL